jgi:hypothetical protein
MIKNHACIRALKFLCHLHLFFCIPKTAMLFSPEKVNQGSENAEPAQVRYAFGNTSIGNVFSKEGLPLCPFRTDDYEVDLIPENK